MAQAVMATSRHIEPLIRGSYVSTSTSFYQALGLQVYTESMQNNVMLHTLGVQDDYDDDDYYYFVIIVVVIVILISLRNFWSQVVSPCAACTFGSWTQESCRCGFPNSSSSNYTEGTKSCVYPYIHHIHV